MHILIFGFNGQVATELRSQAKDSGVKVTALDRASADLMDPASCGQAIRDIVPDAVINAAAYTAVDNAETDEATAHTVNAEAPEAMALACADIHVPFVTISTDYVFSGDGTKAWRPEDTPAPQGAYGRTKLAGERAVQSAGGAYAILRTSWVVSAHGNNFVKTMLRLGAERDGLTIVADQIGGPTGAAEIAAACLKIAQALKTAPEKSGVYHFSGAPDVSWADFAREIFTQANLNCAVTDIPSSDYPTPATRPLNSRMDCVATKETFDIDRPDWKESLRDIHNALLQSMMRASDKNCE